MARIFYSEYAKHALRFYSRTCQYGQPVFKSEADKANWGTVHRVLLGYPENIREVVIEVYSQYGLFPEIVEIAATNFGISADKLWIILKEIESKFAKERGLI